MIVLLLRFGPAVIAVVVALMAWTSWNFSTPPTWTQFAERVETEVVSSSVVSRRIGNGTIRHIPTVVVRWPADSASTVELGDVLPGFFSYGARQAQDIADGYRPGMPISVRLFEGQPYADRFDWFKMLHASFISVMTVVVAGIAWVFFVGFAPTRRRS